MCGQDGRAQNKKNAPKKKKKRIKSATAASTIAASPHRIYAFVRSLFHSTDNTIQPNIQPLQKLNNISPSKQRERSRQRPSEERRTPNIIRKSVETYKTEESTCIIFSTLLRPWRYAWLPRCPADPRKKKMRD